MEDWLGHGRLVRHNPQPATVGCAAHDVRRMLVDLALRWQHNRMNPDNTQLDAKKGAS